MRYIFILFLLYSIPWVVSAQNKNFLRSILTKPGYDSNYVESYYEDFLHITFVNLNPNHRISIASLGHSERVSLRPNTRTAYGFGLDYKFLTLELSKAFDAFDKLDPQKGNTKSFSFRAGLTGHRILASALIQSYQGMYISNPQAVFSNWDTETSGYPQRGDITSTILFGSLNYFFNHTQYSTMASLWQIDRQKKSAGSAVLGISASESAISGDSSLTPNSPLATAPIVEPIKKAGNLLAGVNFGYAYNLIFKKKIFVNAMIIPGFNLQYGTYQTVNGDVRKYKSHVGAHGDFRIIGGYNGKKYYYGVHYSNYFFKNNIETNIDFSSFNSYLRIFVGRRFDLSRKKR